MALTPFRTPHTRIPAPSPESGMPAWNTRGDLAGPRPPPSMSASEASFWREIQRQCDEEDAVSAAMAASQADPGSAAAAAAGSSSSAGPAGGSTPAEYLANASPSPAGAADRPGNGRTGPERAAIYQQMLDEPRRARRRTPNSAFQPWGQTRFPAVVPATSPTPPPPTPLTRVQRRRAEAALAAASAGVGANSSSSSGAGAPVAGAGALVAQGASPGAVLSPGINIPERQTVWISPHGEKYHLYYDCKGLEKANSVSGIQLDELMRRRFTVPKDLCWVCRRE